MLGAEQCHQIHLRSLEKYVYSALQPAIDSTGIGHEPDTLAPEALEAALTQHLYARFDGWLARLGGKDAADKQEGQQDEKSISYHIQGLFY